MNKDLFVVLQQKLYNLQTLVEQIILVENLNRQLPKLIPMLKKIPAYSELSNEEAEKVIYEEINSLDPTGKEGSYTEWLIKQIQKNKIKLPDDGDKVKQILTLYHLNKKQKDVNLPKDIYQIDFPELEKLINELKEKNVLREKSLKEQEEEIKGGAEVVYDDGTYVVRKCITPEAVVKYGMGSKWCTTNLKTAEEYLQNGPIFRVHKNGKTYASISHAGIRDVKDRPFDFSKDPQFIMVVWKLRDKIPYTYGLLEYLFRCLRSPKVTPEMLDKLAKEIDLDEYAAVGVKLLKIIASHYKTSHATQQYLFNKYTKENLNSLVLAYLARNINAKPELLRQLYNFSANKYFADIVVPEILENDNTPSDVLLDALKRWDWAAKYVALHPNTPINTLKDLIKKYKDSDILINILYNPKVTPELIRMIYEKKPDWGVLEEMADNVKTPDDILKELLHHRMKIVQETAKAELKRRGYNVSKFKNGKLMPL